MRAAIYARVSSDDKDQDPLNQLLHLREFVAARGWTLVYEYGSGNRKKQRPYRIPSNVDRCSPGPSMSAASPTTDLRPLIVEASKDLAEYQRLTAEGKLGEAGQKLEQLKRTLDELNRLQR